MLLVDASEGPLPQTRFVLRKALEAGLPVVLVVNKVDRPDARIGEVVNEVYELFLDLDANEEQIEFPIVYTNAKAGRASTEEGVEGTDLRPLLDLLVERIPAPTYDESHPLQARVTNLDADPYVGRLALCRVHHGTIRKGQQVAWIRRDGTVEDVRLDRAVRERGTRARAGRRGRSGRDHRHRRHPGDHDRRDDRRPRGPTAASADRDRRARPGRDDRDQHVAARGPVGLPADRAHGAGPARAGARGQRGDPRGGQRPSRHLGGAGPRRASARRAGRDDAARGLRAHRRQAAGGHARGRRQAARADRAARDRRAGGLPRRGHADARAAQGAHGEHGQPRHRLGAARVPRAHARADRLPHRVPHRDARVGDPAFGLRALRALAGRDPHATRPARSWPTAAGPPPRSRC